MGGADAPTSILGTSDYVFVYDNEPRNNEICSRISRHISNGESVVIFPSIIKEKDINDMHLAGHDVQKIVEGNTFQGLTATLKFNDWRK